MLIAALFIMAQTPNNPKLHHLWMEKQNVVHLYNTTLVINEKNWTETCHDTDEIQKKYAKWKKSDANDILYHSIQTKCLEKAKL